MARTSTKSTVASSCKATANGCLKCRKPNWERSHQASILKVEQGGVSRLRYSTLASLSEDGMRWTLGFLAAWFLGAGCAFATELAKPQPSPRAALRLADLGKRLFHDKRLSANGTISCSSCHIPDKAFTDGLAHAKGIGGQLGTRNTPSLLNVALNTSLFWDGRRSTLEEQAQDPFVNPREHGFKNHDEVLAVVRRDPLYRKAFKSSLDAAAKSLTMNHIAQAIAAFERTLVATNSPFDRYFYQGDDKALSAAGRRGLDLFRGRARCTGCHLIDEKGAPFTDNGFHRLGVGMGKIEPRLAEIAQHVVRSKGKPLEHTILSEADVAELGRFAVTLKPADIGLFRTPSLRNVAVTGPYMHDGSVATLDEAVDLELYYRSIETDTPIVLTRSEKSDLLEFLYSLTDLGQKPSRH